MSSKQVEVTLFGTETGKDLRIVYPELSEITEFKDLKPKELRLCWLLGNRTSPIYSVSNKNERLVRGLELVYGKNYDKNRENEWLKSGEMPAKLIAGVRRMEHFNVEYRLKAKLLSEYMFDMLSKMVVLDPAKLSSMDVDDMKKYTDLVVKVHEQLPDIIKRLETAYGVQTVEKTTKKKVMVSINDIFN